MAKGRINQVEALEGVGSSRSDFSNINGAVDSVMYEYAQKFINAAVDRIEKRSKVDLGNMSNIEVSQIRYVNGKYEMTIGYDKSNPASKYYDYQNKGVKGVFNKSVNSPYAYKSLAVSDEMITKIMEWYTRHMNFAMKDDQKKGLSRLQKKSKRIASLVSPQKKLRDIAEATAINIKKKGRPRVGFFEDNLKIFGEEFQRDISQALGQSVVVNIRQVLEAKK